MLQRQHGLVVAGVRIVQRHVDDENDFLAEMVKSDDLVKEHQVQILEGVTVNGFTVGSRFAVAQIVVSEISDEPAGKRRQIRQMGALVAAEKLAQIARRIVGVQRDVAEGHRAARAGNRQFWIKSEKRVAAPALVGQCRLEQIAVTGNIFQNAQRLNGRDEIREQRGAQRQDVVVSTGCDRLDSIKARLYVHENPSRKHFGGSVKVVFWPIKNALDR